MVYYEHAHDNLCVVHSINNLVGCKLINVTELDRYFKREKTKFSVHFDSAGFDLGAVIRYVQLKFNIHFHKFHHFKNIPHKGSFLVSIHKNTYDHMIVVKNGWVIDNEERSKQNLSNWQKHKYKILDMYRVVINV